MQITYIKDSIYLDGVYAGYIDKLLDGSWYGRLITSKNVPTMVSLGVYYKKTEMKRVVKELVDKNPSAILDACTHLAERNKR